MKKTLTLFWQIALFLVALAVASPLAVAQVGPPQITNFTVGAVSDPNAEAIAVAGEFTETFSINPADVEVILTVDKTVAATFNKGSFVKGLFGGYRATATSVSNAKKAGMLLLPLQGGKWFYSAAVEGYRSTSTSVTVELGIGGVIGEATGKAFVFSKRW